MRTRLSMVVAPMVFTRKMTTWSTRIVQMRGIMVARRQCSRWLDSSGCVCGDTKRRRPKFAHAGTAVSTATVLQELAMTQVHKSASEKQRQFRAKLKAGDEAWVTQNDVVTVGSELPDLRRAAFLISGRDQRGAQPPPCNRLLNDSQMSAADRCLSRPGPHFHDQRRPHP